VVPRDSQVRARDGAPAVVTLNRMRHLRPVRVNSAVFASFGNARQLEAAGGELLAEPARRALLESWRSIAMGVAG